MAAPFTTFPIPTTFAVAEWGLPVNVKDFGAVGDNVADDTAAIQAAIDYAYANNRKATYMPAGHYKISSSLYLDPPNNLRSNLGNPPFFQFSLSLLGDVGLGSGENQGTHLNCTFNNTVALYIGPGQGMRVAYFAVHGGGPPGWRGQQDPNGVGVGITGCGGGAYRTEVEAIWVDGFNTAFKTAANGNQSLGDSNIFRLCAVNNAATGFYIAGTQNFVNAFYNCNCSATVGLFTAVGCGGHVWGGNWSGNNGQATTFALTGISTFTQTGSGNDFLLHFNGTLPTGDPWINKVYNSYCIKTTNFGIIPLVVDTYNSGTGAATFSVASHWSKYHFTTIDMIANTDIVADITAAATLYATERLTTFWGTGISVQGVHIENAQATQTIIHAGEGFGSNAANSLSDLYYNYDPSNGDLIGSVDPAAVSKLYNTQVWPYIWIESTSSTTTIENSQLGCNGTTPVLVYSEGGGSRLIMQNNSRFGPVVGMKNPNGGFGLFQWELNPNYLGPGEFDKTPYFATGGNNHGLGDRLRLNGQQRSPAWGFFPAPYTHPGVARYWLTTLEGTLPAIAYSGGNLGVEYPLLFGRQIYNIEDYDFGSEPTQLNLPANCFEFTSDHHLYSYGQDLTTTNFPALSWRYKGQSVFVYVTAGTDVLQALFSGLTIKLNDGSSDVLYVVDGVHPPLGYFSVKRATPSGPWALSGVKTTTFTGAVIKQDPYVIHRLSIPQITNFQAPSAGFSITLTDIDTDLILNPAGVLATGTITMCAKPFDGQRVTIRSSQTVTALTISPNAGQSVSGNPTTITSGQRWEAIYRKSNTTWYFGR